MNPYEILGIEPGATLEEIHSAYRKLAQLWHPDKHPDNQDEATRIFQILEEAYRFLSNSDQRSRFDDLGDEYEDELQVSAVTLLIHLENQMLERLDIDHAAAMREILTTSSHTQKAMIAQKRVEIRRVEDLAKRWKKKQGRNIFKNMYIRKTKEIQNSIADSEKVIEIAAAARKILDDYEFKTGPLREVRMLSINFRF